MLHRALSLALLLTLAGCGAAHEAPDAGAIAIDASDDDAGLDDAGVADPRPCGGACVDGEDLCDEALGACVECLSDADCGGDAPVCSESYCVPCAPDDEACVEPDPTEPDPEPDPEEPDPEEPEPTEPEPVDVRFATYNVRTSNLNNSAWGDTHVGWDDNDAARMRRVADTIADQELTVVAAQEMRRLERDGVLTRLSNRHGQSWGHTTQRMGRDDTFILFRRTVWRLVRQVHFSVPLQAGLEDRFQVGALLQHRATGRRMWFYSVHFAAGGSAGASARATAARRTVASIREHAVERDQPFVLGGDFNAVAGGEVGDILRAAGFMKYTRAVADRRVNDGCKTFNGLAGTAGRQQCPGGAAPHIDHVWVSRPRMDVRRHQVTANERTSRASDHNPVTVVLRQR